MRLHNVLENILDSKSKIRILRTMLKYSGREFTENEIAKSIKMSPNTVNMALKDLTKTNILSYKSIGRANIYRCNKESIFYPVLQNLFKNENSFMEKLVRTIKKHVDKDVESCIIFGSFASGEERFDSDLDLLVVSEKKMDIGMLQSEIMKKFSVVTMPFICTAEELRKKKTLLKQIKKDYITVHGRGVEEYA